MRAPRGYALLTVLLALGLLTVSMGVLLSSLKASIDTTSVELKRRQTFYACDGVGRTVTALAQRYFMEPSPTTQGLIDFVCAEAGNGCSSVGVGNLAKVSANPKLPSITPAGYEIDRLSLGTKGAPKVSPLPNGPFVGMNARQNTMEVLVRMRNKDNDYACETNQELTLGKVSMFQFFVFSDIDMTDLYPDPPMTADGRMHINGDFCVAARDSLKIERLTVAGKLDHLDNCINPGDRRERNNVFFATKASPDFGGSADFQKFLKTDRVRLGWAAYARSTWNGQVLDRAHNVPKLKLPIFGSPIVQAGIDADVGAISNLKNSRFLIDPVFSSPLPAPVDSADIVAQKFAEKADIRIVGRDWYLKDASMPWPGKLIHTDNYDDLPINNISNPPARGKKYSYYDRTKVGTTWTLDDNVDDHGVVSYGLLAQVGSVTASRTWVPGYHCGLRISAFTSNTCSGGSTAPATERERLQLGATDGFRDTHADQHASSSRIANRFPINIDVAALQEALADTAPGELGSYFTTSAFNGIIYVTSDSDLFVDRRASTFAVGSPSSPAKVQQIDTNGPGLSDFIAQQPLPASPPLTGLAWPPAVQPINRPIINAVRVYNARNLNTNSPISGAPTLSAAAQNQLPKGLTIASNLPLYALGDVNRSSELTSTWTPILLAGDVVHVLSNAWTDNYAGWNDRSCSNEGCIGSSEEMKKNDNRARALRDASETTYYLEIIGGTAETTSGTQSGGVNNFLRFMEDWDGSIPVHIRGSLVVGHYPVFSQHPWQCCSAYNAPDRDFGYDTHLDDLNKQPPGAPIYDVQAVKGWTRN
jgi:type II secretory pathway pseudopilin PulG